MIVPMKSLSQARPGASPDQGDSHQLNLRRKCACSSSSASHGECEECRKKRLTSKLPFGQAKLSINEPGDEYELEADRVAEQIMRMAQRPRHKNPLVRMSARENFSQNEHGGHDEVLQQKESRTSGITDTKPAIAAPPIVQNVLSSGGRPLDAETRAFMEPRFGHDFGRVRVHADAAAADSAQMVNALAYTVGSNIVFGAQQYAPDTTVGRKLLGHELVHVLQQSGPSVITTTAPLSESGPNPNAQSATRSKFELVDNNLAITENHTPEIQRSVGSPAGGCGVCLGSPANAGTAAHALIEEAFEEKYGYAVLTEFPLLLNPSEEDENGRLDLAVPTEDGFDIGEIKPANTVGLLQGDHDLFWYEDEIRRYDLEVDRMILDPPRKPLRFPDLVPPGCPPQFLFVTGPYHGIYTYFCEPDFKDLRKDPMCKCNQDREEEKKRAIAKSATSEQTITAVPERRTETSGIAAEPTEEPLPEKIAPAAQVPPTPKFSQDSWTTLERINGMFGYIVNAPRENSLEVIFDWTSDVRSYLIDFISGYSHALKRTFGVGGSLGSEELDVINRLLGEIDRDALRFHETGASELLQKIVDTMIEVIQYIHEQAGWELEEDLWRGGPYIAAGLVVVGLTAYLAVPLVGAVGGGSVVTTTTTATGTGLGTTGTTSIAAYTSTGVPLSVFSGGASAGGVTIGGSSIPAAAVTTTQIAAGFAGAVIVGESATSR